MSNISFYNSFQKYSGSYYEDISKVDSVEIGLQRYKTNDDSFEEDITITPSPDKGIRLVENVNCGQRCFYLSITNNGKNIIYQPIFEIKSEMPFFMDGDKKKYEILSYSDDYSCLRISGDYNRCPVKMQLKYHLIPQGFTELEICYTSRLKKGFDKFESEHFYTAKYGRLNLSILEIPKESDFSDNSLNIFIDDVLLKKINVVFFENITKSRCENENN